MQVGLAHYGQCHPWKDPQSYKKAGRAGTEKQACREKLLYGFCFCPCLHVPALTLLKDGLWLRSHKMKQALSFPQVAFGHGLFFFSHSNRNQLREQGIYFSSQFEAVVHYSGEAMVART